MTRTKIDYKTDIEYTRLRKNLLSKGFKKIADCYWCQIFTKGNEEITLNRE